AEQRILGGGEVGVVVADQVVVGERTGAPEITESYLLSLHSELAMVVMVLLGDRTGEAEPRQPDGPDR
ncbi:MAG: hypothetical protein ACRDTT_02815, partial [Pseudonocardiaceae bacterium]